ncbi:hypothetical protein ED236_00950 [Pseudomethylobacillus aquaticus]|uniref:Uncharacterized protein n=1 Tax=Pseudomethylobacillus aquaticus TaxID=2676064 RepID=A0A3N0V654_9PROT|nr:hypothetical protein [Pseudomethylobacillus aquaticus]ROH88082.1 hypothetical protein ED236_00950 [Pseudomethylobacillus aquaticus]
MKDKREMLLEGSLFFTVCVLMFLATGKTYAFIVDVINARLKAGNINIIDIYFFVGLLIGGNLIVWIVMLFTCDDEHQPMWQHPCLLDKSRSDSL